MSATAAAGATNGHTNGHHAITDPYTVVNPDVATPATPVPIRFTQLFIDGRFVDSVSGKQLDVVNPNTGDKIASVSEADAADVDIAVKAARAAYNGPWSKLSAYERGQLLFRWAELMEQHADELAALDAADNGKTFAIARGFDIEQSIHCFRYFAGWATKIQGKTISMEGDYEAYTRHEPIGVVGAIVPWNFPMMMATWKLAPCLACGNTVVIKSSEKTPLSLLFLAHLAQQAGFPPGVLNAISGYGPTAGNALALHMDVDKIAFTGSTPVGRKMLIASANSNLKKVTVELGGKSPAIVFPDCDVQAAVDGVHVGLFFNAGQVCCAGSRIYVHESIHDEFVKLATAKIKSQPLSSAVNKGSSMQPIVDDIQQKRVLGYIEKGKAEGATLLAGGQAGDKAGYFVQPTLFTDVQDSMAIASEEIFGPVLSVLRFSSIDEVIERANSSVFGLAAAVWTQDVAKAKYVANRIKAGTVWVNCHNQLSYSVPFGGYKQSGIGRDLGEYALHEYTTVKSVITSVPSDSSQLKLNILKQ